MTYDNAEEVKSMAQAHGFQIRLIPMNNTNHATIEELVVGKDLSWMDQYPSVREPRTEYSEKDKANLLPTEKPRLTLSDIQRHNSMPEDQSPRPTYPNCWLATRILIEISFMRHARATVLTGSDCYHESERIFYLLQSSCNLFRFAGQLFPRGCCIFPPERCIVLDAVEKRVSRSYFTPMIKKRIPR